MNNSMFPGVGQYDLKGEKVKNNYKYSIGKTQRNNIFSKNV